MNDRLFGGRWGEIRFWRGLDAPGNTDCNEVSDKRSAHQITAMTRDAGISACIFRSQLLPVPYTEYYLAIVKESGHFS
jgi:hypothetical protein